MSDLEASAIINLAESLSSSTQKYTNSISQMKTSIYAYAASSERTGYRWQSEMYALNNSVSSLDNTIDDLDNTIDELDVSVNSLSKTLEKFGAQYSQKSTKEGQLNTDGVDKPKQPEFLDFLEKGVDIAKQAVDIYEKGKSIAQSFKKGSQNKLNSHPTVNLDKSIAPISNKDTESKGTDLVADISKGISVVSKAFDVYKTGKSVVEGFKKGGFTGGVDALLNVDVNKLLSGEEQDKSTGEGKAGVQKVYVVNMGSFSSNKKGNKKKMNPKKKGINLNKKAAYNPSANTIKGNSLLKNFNKVSKFGPLKYISGAIQGADILNNNNLSTEEKAIEATKLVGETGGAALGMWGGAAAGAAIGSVVPIVGTAIGGLIGGVLGGWLGGEAGGALATEVTDAVTEPSKDTNKLEPQSANIKIQVEGEAKIKSVETKNMDLDVAGSSMGTV